MEGARRKSCRNARCDARGLCEPERRRTLERCGQNRSGGHAADVDGGQGREQAQRRDDTDKQKGQNRQPRPAVIAMRMRDHEEHESDTDCDCRNQ